MRNADHWSLFALAMAVLCMLAGRDISANVFLGALIAIQGLAPDGPSERHAQRVRLMLGGLSAGIIAYLLFSGSPQWAAPTPW